MRIALVAGESSGDLLGAGLIRVLKERYPDAVFEGVAGPAMVAAGCHQIEPSESLAVFGLIEPLRHLPRLLRLRRSLVKRWKASPPDVFVGIDAPDFNLSLEKKLRASGIKTVHYVSPSIWAWRAGRIKTVKAAADKVLCILPFEESLYEGVGVDATFVGHPKADSAPLEIDVPGARRALGLTADEVIAVLPGSRKSEVAMLGDILAEAAARIAQSRSSVQFVTPVATAALRPAIEAQIAAAGMTEHFILTRGRLRTRDDCCRCRPAGFRYGGAGVRIADQAYGCDLQARQGDARDCIWPESDAADPFHDSEPADGDTASAGVHAGRRTARRYRECRR